MTTLSTIYFFFHLEQTFPLLVHFVDMCYPLIFKYKANSSTVLLNQVIVYMCVERIY